MSWSWSWADIDQRLVREVKGVREKVERASRNRNPPVDECVRGGREGVYDLVLVPQVKEETAARNTRHRILCFLEE